MAAVKGVPKSATTSTRNLPKFPGFKTPSIPFIRDKVKGIGWGFLYLMKTL
jgi:hypothetical protein